MTAIERTAYPRFKRALTTKDLEEVYTPTPQERFLALRSTKGTVAEAGFLVLLKTHQRLGRFIALREVPVAILNHILMIVDPTLTASDLETYDSSGTRQRHVPLIRAARELHPYSPAARTCALKAMIGVARTKEDVADLINVALESLAKECFELPPFATLDKAAHHVRAITTRGLYRQVAAQLDDPARAALEQLFVVPPGASFSPWELLKQEPASPTLMHMRSLIDHLFAISEQRRLLAFLRRSPKARSSSLPAKPEHWMPPCLIDFHHLACVRDQKSPSHLALQKDSLRVGDKQVDQSVAHVGGWSLSIQRSEGI